MKLTLRAVVIAVFLTLILATANAFLALKLGMLTSASIPAAILSMGILRFFKDASILENNLIQTAASAGEAVAGGIVYTIPALVIIGYWHHFDYWQNFLIALLSGVLGVIFSVPLRKSLIHHKGFPFPEGRAIAAILQNHSSQKGFRFLVWGIVIGAIVDFSQTGLHLLSTQWGAWFQMGHSLFFVAVGFSVSMMSAGFLMGSRMALSIIVGAILSWYIILPAFSHGWPMSSRMVLWNEHVRYVGIGGLLCAGLLSLLFLIKPLIQKMVQVQAEKMVTDDTEKDIPMKWLAGLVLLVCGVLYLFLSNILPLATLGLSSINVMWALGFIVCIGFVLAVVSGYFSAMVGVSASPGSSVVITALLLAAWGVLMMCGHGKLLSQSPQLLAAEAIVIILASMVTGIAAIANDNIQDLKVGQIIGATPWRQQVMLMLGVLVSASIIPAVMQILYQVYGIAGHGGGEYSLPAPTAVLLGTLTDGFFQHVLPWNMISLGGGLVLLVMLLLRIPFLNRLGLSIFGIAIGMYLPLETSIPLMIGGGLAGLLKSREAKAFIPKGSMEFAICLACGLVAGSAVMDVVLAFVFALSNNVNGLALLHGHSADFSALLTGGLVIALVVWIARLKRA